jgi:hypothetical protein
MKTWVKITLSAAFLVSGCLSAAPPSSLSVAPKTAEQDELVTDRPDFTESSEVTRRNWTQVESGVALELSSQDHERRLSLGNLLVRMGLTDRLELRLGSEGLMHDAGSSPVSAGLFGRSDMDAGSSTSLWMRVVSDRL